MDFWNWLKRKANFLTLLASCDMEHFRWRIFHTSVFILATGTLALCQSCQPLILSSLVKNSSFRKKWLCWPTVVNLKIQGREIWHVWGAGRIFPSSHETSLVISFLFLQSGIFITNSTIIVILSSVHEEFSGYCFPCNKSSFLVTYISDTVQGWLQSSLCI